MSTPRSRRLGHFKFKGTCINEHDAFPLKFQVEVQYQTVSYHMLPWSWIFDQPAETFQRILTETSWSQRPSILWLEAQTFDFVQGSHRLEKYLNLEGFLEKSLKIKSALKSTGKSLKSLEKSLNSTIFYRT